MPQNLKSYNFKSVGKTETEVQGLVNKTSDDIALGIKTPIEYSTGQGELFRMHREIAPQVMDNFRNLLLTNHGERLMHYDFGANLLPLAFELGTEDVDAVAMDRISTACAKYMSFVELKQFIPFTIHQDNEHIAKVGISVIFDIHGLGMTNRQIDVIIYTAG